MIYGDSFLNPSRYIYSGLVKNRELFHDDTYFAAFCICKFLWINSYANLITYFVVIGSFASQWRKLVVFIPFTSHFFCFPTFEWPSDRVY